MYYLKFQVRILYTITGNVLVYYKLKFGLWSMIRVIKALLLQQFLTTVSDLGYNLPAFQNLSYSLTLMI